MSYSERTIDLSGVPETMLWPLWNRAAEQQRRNRLLDDPLAADLVARIDYDFAGRFGRPNVHHVIRARLGDELIQAHVDACGNEQPVVVCLGDGLDTQPWRVADPRIHWLNVDVSEALALRERLWPVHAKTRTVRCSALDPKWTEAVPADCMPFISAAGLLMYCQPIDVIRLLAMIADRMPGAMVFFDTIPPCFSRKKRQGFHVTARYREPRMSWGISVDDLPAFLDAIPGVTTGRVWTYADPYPERLRLLHLLSRIGPLRRRLAAGLAVARTVRKTRAFYMQRR